MADYKYDNEDSDKTRASKLSSVVSDSKETDSNKHFQYMLVASILLPIVPLAFLIWPPLWSKWKMSGFLGVVTGWGCAIIVMTFVI